MQNEQTNEFISLLLYKNQPMPYLLDIVNETEKAYQLKNQDGQLTWLPKKVLSYDDNYRVYKMADWFRKKLSFTQLSILQG